jgi:uncharacterized protein YjiS (DUF1127 family)
MDPDVGRKQEMRKAHVWLSYSEPTASWPKPSFRNAANQLPVEQNGNKKMIFLKTISEKLNARRRYRAAVSELSKLSDHELSDIGIGRGDIEHVARRPVASKASA